MPRIYAACLASYNNGVLHGTWIDLTDPEDVQNEIAEMLRRSPHPNVMVDCPDCEGSGDEPSVPDMLCAGCNGTGKVPSAEEWAAHDYDDVPGSWGECPDIEKLCEFVGLYEEHGEAYAAFVDHFDETDEDSFQDRYSGEWRSAEEWAEDYIESTGQLDANNPLASYFDYERYARDCAMGGDMTFVAGGRGVFAFNNH